MDKATAEKLVKNFGALVAAYIAETENADTDIKYEFAAKKAMDEAGDTMVKALTHPPVSQPLPTAKPQGEVREEVAMEMVELVRGYASLIGWDDLSDLTKNNFLKVADRIIAKVNPIEGKGSAGECKHQNMRKLNYTEERICIDCHKIFTPEIRYIQPDHIPDTNKMVPLDAKPKEEGDKCRFSECDGEYGYRPVENCQCHLSPPCHSCVDNPLVCLDCGDDLPDADLPEAPPDHLPALTKVIQSELLDTIDKLECVIDECSAAHEHGDNTVDALTILTPLLDVMKYLKSLHIPGDMQSKAADPIHEALSPEMKEYRNLFFSAEASFRNGYMCGVSDMEIVRLGNKPPGEDERLKVFLSSLKSWEPALEDRQIKALDPLYDKSAEFRAGYLWGIGEAADHAVDMRDMIPKSAPEVVEGAPRDYKAQIDRLTAYLIMHYTMEWPRDKNAVDVAIQLLEAAPRDEEEDTGEYPRPDDSLLGRLTRRVEYLEDSQMRQNDWLRDAKKAAGYPDSVSFDVVWDAALKALKNGPQGDERGG